MNPATSLLLDLLRVLAACGVVLVHSGTTRFAPSLSIDPELGHRCVVVFFVLSGYVIAHASFSRPQSASDYAIARVSRLYSVLAPALFVTAVLLVWGQPINPEFYAPFRGNEPVRFALSLGFLNEIWWLSAAPRTNNPLWSLSYEFWYYTLFGVAVFMRRRFVTVMMLIAIAAVAGPKILLLLPVWLLGVGAYLLTGRAHLRRGLAGFALVVTVFLLILWWGKGTPFPGRAGDAPLYFSNEFGSDFVLGLLVAGLIFYFHQVSANWRFSRWIEAPVKGGANMTFSLYLLHHPMLVFLGATVPYDHMNRAHAGLLLIGVFTFAAIFSRFTEAQRKPLAAWLRRRWKAMRSAEGSAA